MRIAFGLVVFLAACGSDPDMFPNGGGSSNGFPDSGGNGQVDARMIDAKVADAKPLAIDAALFNGRVCLLTDARDFETCAMTGANGLTVHIGGNAAVTAADGTFTIAAPAQGGGTTWSVTGANIVSSYKVKNDYFIPAMTHTMFDALVTTNLAPLVPAGTAPISPGEGSVMVHVIRNGAGYAGATASSGAQTNQAKYNPLYDNDANQNDWNQLPSNVGAATGSKGAVWFAGFDVGDAIFTVTPPGGTATTVAAQPVLDQGITWVDVIFNP